MWLFRSGACVVPDALPYDVASGDLYAALDCVPADVPSGARPAVRVAEAAMAPGRELAPPGVLVDAAMGAGARWIAGVAGRGAAAGIGRLVNCTIALCGLVVAWASLKACT